MTDFTDQARDILSVAIHRAKTKSADDGVAHIATALAAAYERGREDERKRGSEAVGWRWKYEGEDSWNYCSHEPNDTTLVALPLIKEKVFAAPPVPAAVDAEIKRMQDRIAELEAAFGKLSKMPLTLRGEQAYKEYPRAVTNIARNILKAR